MHGDVIKGGYRKKLRGYAPTKVVLRYALTKFTKYFRVIQIVSKCKQLMFEIHNMRFELLADPDLIQGQIFEDLEKLQDVRILSEQYV